jgi:hypothetical protein
MACMVVAFAGAFAGTLEAPPAPAALPQARLIGEGRLDWFGLRVYEARLWAAAALDAADFTRAPFVLEITYRRSLQGSRIAQRSIEEMRRAGDFGDDEAQRWEVALAALLPDVAPGDRLAGVNLPGRGARFTFNGRDLGGIGDARFARLFFAIWLAPTTSEPALRAALLGGGRP